MSSAIDGKSHAAGFEQPNHEVAGACLYSYKATAAGLIVNVDLWTWSRKARGEGEGESW